jgi:hypothetical protein
VKTTRWKRIGRATESESRTKKGEGGKDEMSERWRGGQATGFQKWEIEGAVERFLEEAVYPVYPGVFCVRVANTGLISARVKKSEKKWGTRA